jgi:hypothetical protein
MSPSKNRGTLVSLKQPTIVISILSFCRLPRQLATIEDGRSQLEMDAGRCGHPRCNVFCRPLRGSVAKRRTSPLAAALSTDRTCSLEIKGKIKSKMYDSGAVRRMSSKRTGRIFYDEG